MRSVFERELIAMQEELSALKATKTRTSSEMPTRYTEITVTAEICGYISGQYLETLPTKAGVAKITLENAGFISWSVASSPGYRRIFIRPRTDDGGNYELLAYIPTGSPDDARELNGDQNLKKSINIRLGVVATCGFTYTTYQTEDITS